MSNADSTRKSVRLKTQRDGSLRAHWYGQYKLDNKHREINLNVHWRGNPPASGRWSEPGDGPFEVSRATAEAALAAHVEEARHKGRVEHLTERLIESKTGQSVEYTRIDALPDRWRTLGRDTEVTEKHLVNCDAHFRRFIDFMKARRTGAVYLYEVTKEDAAAFSKDLRTPCKDDGKHLSPSTAQYAVRLLNKSLSRFLPVGAANPFSDFIGRRSKEESGVIHRKPFTADELRAILDTARTDRFMYPLIVTAACTGMRRGDVCNLDWQAVDLAGNMLTVKTSKTEATVEIPIFPPLREVLIARRPKASGHVFPDAAATLINSRGALTWGFKKIVTRALDASAPQPPPTPTPAAEVEADGTAAIMANVPEGDRRNRMLAIFHAYCAGASVRDIEQRTGTARATVSLHLHAVENWVGKPFMRSGAGRHSKGSITAAIARCTRTQRQPGQMSASTRDWHALRTTFVTLALSAGVPVEIVQRVTGHKTVAVVMEHYFRPDREQFRAVLTDAMPAVLTGAKTPAKTGHDLVTIAAKVSAGTATAAEKELFKRMAALV